MPHEREVYTPLEVSEWTAEGVAVRWPDGERSFFHHVWLRDNCACAECGDAPSGRRALRLTGLPLDIAATAVDTAGGASLTLHWPDGHVTRYTAQWLHEHAYDEAARRRRVFTPRPWTEHTRAAPPTLDFADALADDHAFLRMLEAVRDHGICFLTGAPAEPGTLERLAVRVGPLQESNFGRVLDLLVDNGKRSIANDVHALKPHTDEPYRASPPGLVMFHCIESDVDGGGSSLFLDGFEIAETLRREDPEAFAALSRHRQGFRRHYHGEVDLMTEFPPITVDEFGNLMGVRINDRVAAPLAIDADAVPLYYRGLRRLLALSEDPERMLHRALRPGDVVVFDNHRVLHGRNRLSISGRRFLQHVQVERGDFHSALRITADRLQAARDAGPLLRGAYG